MTLITHTLTYTLIPTHTLTAPLILPYIYTLLYLPYYHTPNTPTSYDQAKHAGLKERVALIRNVEVDIADQLEEYARVGQINRCCAIVWGVEIWYTPVPLRCQGLAGSCGCRRVLCTDIGMQIVWRSMPG